ncbi:hypothetical protein JTE90_016115 [Oedothorax gibbosus]|uniref:Uncharacterized protein n=1 Tax=Oedothorax gibbosus TaxID=931172 RepID=A0AAV6U3N0_9ARAC|nr:hypothetical protein JTE90_016115 [Oedothorax gibbosus]
MKLFFSVFLCILWPKCVFSDERLVVVTLNVMKGVLFIPRKTSVNLFNFICITVSSAQYTSRETIYIGFPPHFSPEEDKFEKFVNLTECALLLGTH